MRQLVSVITTVYNAEKFLAEAISSVMGQAFCDWEMLIVDDGSDDRSIEIAKAWSGQDARITVLSHPGGKNLGISASRNLGISQCSGSLICFLDADDVWLPGNLDSQMAVLDAHPEAAMAVGSAERWYSWEATQPPLQDFVVTACIPGLGSDRIIPPPELLNAFLEDESLTPCTCTVMVRRRALLQAGGFEASFRGLYDDQVFYAKLALAEPVYLSSKCIARYRQHENSCCANAHRLGTQAQERNTFLNWLKEYRLACARSH